MSSWLTIEKIYQYCPTRLNVTDDGYRDLNGPVANGNWDFHVAGQAVDFANKSAENMRDAALWWYQFAGYLKELIHTTPFNTDNGFYVKDGIKRAEGYYGAATEAAHENHVHVAVLDGNAEALLSRLVKQYGPPGVPATTPPVVPSLTPEQLSYNSAFNAGWESAWNVGFNAGFLSARSKK